MASNVNPEAASQAAIITAYSQVATAVVPSLVGLVGRVLNPTHAPQPTYTYTNETVTVIEEDADTSKKKTTITTKASHSVSTDSLVRLALGSVAAYGAYAAINYFRQ